MDSNKADRARARKERFLERRALFAAFPASDLRISKTAGRAVFASRDIKAGELLLREAATANVLVEEAAKDFCQTCLHELPTSPGQPMVVCSSCKARHCSQACQDRDRYHPFECPLNSKRVISDAAIDADVSVDLLRLLARLVIARYLDSQDSSSERPASPDIILKPTPYRLVEDMIAQEKMASEKWNESVTEGSRILLSQMPDQLSSGLVPAHLVGLACRINANSFAIGDPEGALNVLSVCLFPLGCMFNHSCSPNACFVAGSQKEAQGEVLIRAVRDIKEGEELTISYINMYQPRPARRQELLSTKYFYCECPRCSSKKGSKTWLADLKIDGLKCPACGGLFAPDSDDLDYESLPSTSTLSCLSCNATTPLSSYLSKSSQLTRDHATALDMYSSGRHNFASTLFARFLQNNEPTWSDAHHLLYDADNKLSGSLSHVENNFSKALSHLNSALTRLESSEALPEIWPDRANLLVAYAQLSEMQAELVAAKKGPSTGQGEEEASKLVEQAKKAWDKAIEMCVVLYGEGHPRTNYVKRQAGCPVPV